MKLPFLFKSVELHLYGILDAKVSLWGKDQVHSGGPSLVVRWLGLSISTAGGMTSIPGQGTKTLHATRHGKKKKGKERKNMTVESAWKWEH